MRTSLRLFGTPLIHVDDRSVRFENRKVAALLAYLACNPQPHSREKLAALLWPETAGALAALRTTLWELRKKTDTDLLTITRQDVQLEPGDDFWCDVHDYRMLITASARPGTQVMQRIEAMQHAADLYQDDFMAGFSLRDAAEFDDWLTAQTAHLQRQQQRLLADLVALYRQVRDTYAAIQTAERLRMIDRLAEEPVDLLLRLYADSGQVQAVSRLYEDYTALLDHELGLEPSDALNGLVRSLLHPSGAVKATTEIAQAVARPVTGVLVAGHTSAVIVRTPQTVLGRPRQLIGRDSLVERVLGLLTAGERVVLTGLGGIGKTALAAAACAAYIDATGQPAIWLEAGFQGPRDLFAALARPFNHHQEVLGLGDPAPVMMQLLDQFQGLVVLDNCWNASALFDVVSAIPYHLPVLITSRQRIPIEGEIITVDRLTPADARALLSYHALRDLPPTDGVTALLTLLGHHPYALEIAGKQLKVQPGLTLDDLTGRYARGTHEIAIPGGFGGEDRRSIDRVIGTSVATVSALARTILTTAGGLAAARASLEWMALALAAPLTTLDAAFAELEQASLLEISSTETLPSYHLHDLVYRYCRDLFQQAGGDRLPSVRAARAFLTVHSREVLAVEAEFVNIMGAVRAALHLGDADSVIAIMRAVMVDGYFDARGYTPELLEHLDIAVQFASDLGAQDDLHYLLTKRANARMMRGDPERALHDIVRALAAAPTAHRQALMAFLAANSAYVLKRPEYAAYLAEAEATARGQGFDDVLCRIVEFRGVLESEAGDLEASRRHHREAVAIAQRLRSPQHLFFSNYNLAVAEIDLGDYDSAERTLAEAWRHALAEQNDLWKGLCWSALGRCTDARGDRAETLRLMGEALAVYERVGNQALVQWVREFLADKQYG